MIRRNPLRSRKRIKRKLFSVGGKNAKSTFEPSKGGSGNRLNTPSAMLMRMITLKNNAREGGLYEMLRSNTPNTAASKKLLNGPAAAIAPAPRFGSLRYAGLYGTGFAQPKMIVGCPNSAGIARRSGRITEPTGS